MRNTWAAVVAATVVGVTLLASAPAAHATSEWMSQANPTRVKSNDGVTLGQAYGKSSVGTVNANNRATYRRTAGKYSIYVRSYFLFYYYDSQSKSTGWWTDATEVHNGTYTKNVWKSSTRSETLHPRSEKARIISQACTEVPFLVPGNCTGQHIVTLSY